MLLLFSLFPRFLLLTWIARTVAQSCGSQMTPIINASDAWAIVDPFQPPTGPLGAADARAATWTWTLATTSLDSPTSNKSVEDRLWLDIQPSMDLTDPKLGYLGCGAIFHGLNHKTLQNGQHDDGSCSSIFSPNCLRALMNTTHNISVGISAYTTTAPSQFTDGLTAFDLCNGMAMLQPNDEFGYPSECSDSFNDDAWIETFVFASPQTHTMCSDDPASGNLTSPLATWGHSTYSSVDMTSYENLTTLVTPLMITMATNRTLDENLPGILWTQPHLRCMLPKDFAIGSAQPTGVPNGAGRMASVSISISVAFLAILTALI